MKRFAENLSMVFAAGCLGAVINSLTLWYAGDAGLTAKTGVMLAPHLSASWLYPRIVWGGIFGALFLLPISRYRCVLRGLVLSLGPTMVQLLVIFPLKVHKGWLGLDLGLLTPVWVIAVNAVWGLSASIWLRWAAGK